jgi:hypothetical protein
MNRLISRVRQPVKRLDAEYYLLLMLLSFAASVTLTRAFLFLTGYPQIGGGDLHVAHLLWGGLFLFVASLLPLILANRWALNAAALLSGLGVGLFIDEVGKFITSANDYFYPAAAPIIYAFFLLTVLVYLRVRRPPAQDARSALYRVLEGLHEVLDRDLDREERADLEAQLRYIAEQKEHPDLAHLARELSRFIASDALHMVDERPSLAERLIIRWRAIQARWINRPRLKMFLVVGFAALGVQALFDPAVVGLTIVLPADWGRWLPRLVDLGRVSGAGGLMGFRLQLALEGAVGVLMWAGSILLVLRRERVGLMLGYLGLLLSLTTVNLLVFFFEQFSTIALALAQFGLLLGVIHFRRRYLATVRES